MSRIYTVLNRADGNVARYVRANTLNAAVRAHASEVYEARPSSTEEIYQASLAGALRVLNAVKPEQGDMEDELDPGPVPARVA
jgi:hypothetical protein